MLPSAGEVRRSATHPLLTLLGILTASCARFGYELEGDGLSELGRTDADAGGLPRVAGATPGAGGLSGNDISGAGAGGGNNAGRGGSAAGASAVLSSCNTWGPFGAPELVTGLGTDNYLKPAPSADGSELLVTRSNNGQAEILRATRDGRGPVFSRATRLPYLNSNDGSARGTPFLSADGLTLYYYSNQAGGVGNRDLYATTRSATSAEFLPGAIVPNVNSSAVDHMPSLSADELQLAFVSQRNQGNNDLWGAERGTRNSSFGAPRALAELNTSGNEESPTLSADGLELVFASDRSGGRGGLDLWRSTRARRQDSFSAPVNLSPLDSSDDEHEAALSADGAELFFVVDGNFAASVGLFHSLRSCLD